MTGYISLIINDRVMEKRKYLKTNDRRIIIKGWQSMYPDLDLIIHVSPIIPAAYMRKWILKSKAA